MAAQFFCLLVNLSGMTRLPDNFKIRMTKSNRIIGIVSGTLGPSGLSVAYSSDYIDELIEVLLKSTRTKPVIDRLERKTGIEGQALSPLKERKEE